MAVQPKVDVVTIGAGWTAAILAWKLTSAGTRVVSLEQGEERWTATDVDFTHNHDALRHSVRKRMMLNLHAESWTWRPNPDAPALPMRQFGSFHPGDGTGGSGVHWAAQTWRFYPSDFLYRSHHVERYGEGKLPDGSTIQDWPLTYEDLEPHYTAFEQDIGVSGNAGNLNGQILPGGNPFEGERSAPYPLPPLQNSLAALEFMQASEALGYHPFPQPASILSEAYTGLSGMPRSGCLYCGFCTRYGCEVDAKASALTDHLQLSLATGDHEIRYNSKVTGIVMGDDGLATGLRYVDVITGEEHEQPADIVILSGFTLTNVRMLLLSGSPSHPDGVGNNQGMVGRNYTYQLSRAPASGVFEGRRFNLYMGNSCVQGVIHDFNADNFDHSDLDFIGGASITAGAGEREPLTSTLGLVSINSATFGDYSTVDTTQPGLSTEFGPLTGTGVEWGSDWKENLRNNWDSVVGINIQGESLPYEDQFLDLDPRYTDALGLPLLRITYDFHENDYRLYEYLAQRCIEIMEDMGPTRMSSTEQLSPYVIHEYQTTHNTGGAIMGDDPANSVTNKYGQVWDAPNVFVTGAALFPQNPGMNPTGTVTALAYHTGDAMVKTYLDNPNELMT
ncbi:MAG: GMC family oxidoreductase [Chloroflexota bacterium]|nr:GMC family oxidoreductase [Chloroflexota bacterium]